MLKFSFRLQVFIGFAISVVLVLVVGGLSYQSITQLESDTNAVEHTQRVIKTSTGLQQLLTDAETGMRGFVATNNSEFLDPYYSSLPVIKINLSQLADLIADNPVQLKRVDSLKALVAVQLNILKENIAVRPIKGLDYMVQNHMVIRGKHTMDQFRLLTFNIIRTENQLLAIRKAKTLATTGNVLLIIAIGCVVFLIIIIFLFFYIQGTFDRQQQIETEIKVANVELEKLNAENRAKNWLLTGASRLNEKMQGQQSDKELAENTLTEICTYAKALTGTLYLFDEDNETLNLYASFAFHNPEAIRKTIKLSEGWIGQAAKDKKAGVIKGKLNEALMLESSIIHQNLMESFIVPFFFDKALKGVIELAFDDKMQLESRDYILNVADAIGIAVNTAQARTIMHNLLQQVQQQTEELEVQQEEMRVTNEELLTKTEMLQESEEELTVQQEELRAANAELEEKANLLEERNRAIEKARHAIDIKVQELETTGKYKSEFLANMSHELRTPLNSILVLAQILKENKPANLSADQIKYASVIFNAGNDLLTLINDILDLSKVESGKLELFEEEVKIADILNDMEMLFAEIASDKKIFYTVSVEKNNPGVLQTDKMRIEQVLKNLLSNAFKFTSANGSVSLRVSENAVNETISFYIKDTGIGIPHDKQKVIFEAFQQADGSTSRKYGGTGLGLSISRELVIMLGGKITLTSEPGKGSEFVLTVPKKGTTAIKSTESVKTVEEFQNGKPFLMPAKQLGRADNRQPLVVIIEDDVNFANILNDYSVEHGYRTIIINDGTHAVSIIEENLPDAVILDIMLPGKDGWQILKELKRNTVTVNIPVHLMSASDTTSSFAKQAGAISFMKKPVDAKAIDKLFEELMLQSGTKFKHILLVEDNAVQSDAINELMSNQGITVDQAFDGESALHMLQKNDYQCMILDLNLPDISGLDFLDNIKAIDQFKDMPVIINTAMELDKTSINRLMRYADAMVVKTNKSANRLIDEVNLFLNKINEIKFAQNRGSFVAASKAVKEGKNSLNGKKVLIADDDMRNIFALSSALQNFEMVVETAGDGQEAIHKLETVTGIDIVLMDIMMPVMDGYEAIIHIRNQNKWAKLPIIALTAKAMKDDREKCMEAGANDYITKPVEIDRLVALMQLWMAV